MQRGRIGPSRDVYDLEEILCGRGLVRINGTVSGVLNWNFFFKFKGDEGRDTYFWIRKMFELGLGFHR